MFGHIELVKQTEDDVIGKFDDGHTFRIQARGAEQKLRGLKWLNRRPDLVICDDMESDEAVLNKERREKFKRWFYSALIPCLSVDGKVRIVGTILHLDSLLERLMPENQLLASARGQLITEPLKQYTNSKVPWKSVKYRAHTDDFSQILWRTRWSANDLREKRASYAQQGLLDAYSQEMLNIPLDEQNTFFRSNDFIAISPEDAKKKLNYYIAADLAISLKQKADYSVFVVAGMDDTGRLQIVNVIRDRLDGMEIVDTMLMLQRLYNPELFGIESGVIQKSIGPYLNEAMIAQGTYIHLALLKPSGDKLTRAKSVQARMRAGAIRFDREAEWYQTFEDELMRFPRDRHDDQVDAFAYIGLMLDRMIVHETPQEEEEEEYFLSTREETQGRSAVTGY